VERENAVRSELVLVEIERLPGEKMDGDG